MEVRFSTDPESFKGMNSQTLRRSFLMEGLFAPDTVPMVYAELDRSITGSAVPVTRKLRLESSRKEMAADYFAERREIGIINIGAEGAVLVDGKEYVLESRDALYIGRGAKEVVFSSCAAGTPAKFYFVSYPAHREYPTQHIRLADAAPLKLGSTREANQRTIHKYIHPGAFPTCQLVMGLTQLEPGSVWNTWPPHTHQRRSEVYLYFGLDENAAVIHLMGQPEETRHLIVRNQQAIIAPSWSIHAGVGTQSYAFIWAMGGENQVFDDMDGISIQSVA
jgi:4-deoxy-L-threo-5-hexosulose-uronate ketol-isomerase